jgi:hypothetical protein
VDPQAGTVVGVENEKGEAVGRATPLDALANLNRARRKPDPVFTPMTGVGPNGVELAYRQCHGIKEA